MDISMHEDYFLSEWFFLMPIYSRRYKIEYKYLYQKADFEYYKDHNDFNEKKLINSLKFIKIFLILELIICLAVTIKLLIDGFDLTLLKILINSAVTTCITYFNIKTVKKLYKIYKEPFSENDEEEITIKITPIGIIESDQYNNQFLFKWKEIRQLQIYNSYLHIIAKKRDPLFIPLRIFTDQDEQWSFIQEIKKSTGLKE